MTLQQESGGAISSTTVSNREATPSAPGHDKDEGEGKSDNLVADHQRQHQDKNSRMQDVCPESAGTATRAAPEEATLKQIVFAVAQRFVRGRQRIG